MFQKIRSDLATYGGEWTQQGFWALIVFRMGQWSAAINNRIFRAIMLFVYGFFQKLIEIVTGIYLPREVVMGNGFRIDHFSEIIIQGGVVIGDGCIVRNGVMIGSSENAENLGFPVIGNNVNIGTGAKILGNIVIGDNVDIGANAVVLENVPSNSIAVGLPARIISKKDKEAAC